MNFGGILVLSLDIFCWPGPSFIFRRIFVIVKLPKTEPHNEPGNEPDVNPNLDVLQRISIVDPFPLVVVVTIGCKSKQDQIEVFCN